MVRTCRNLSNRSVAAHLSQPPRQGPGMTTELASFTSQQRAAITARGNVLVMAGAGTGKTRTLVECCVRDLLRGHANLDHILMVPFTEAAAAEMRERIR